MRQRSNRDTSRKFDAPLMQERPQLLETRSSLVGSAASTAVLDLLRAALIEPSPLADAVAAQRSVAEQAAAATGLLRAALDDHSKLEEAAAAAASAAKAQKEMQSGGESPDTDGESSSVGRSSTSSSGDRPLSWHVQALDPSLDLKVLCQSLSPCHVLAALSAVCLGRTVIIRSRAQSTLALAVTALARLSAAALHRTTEAKLSPKIPNERTKQPRNQWEQHSERDSLHYNAHSTAAGHLVVPMLALADLQALPERRRQYQRTMTSGEATCAQFQGLDLPSQCPCLVGVDSRIFALLQQRNALQPMNRRTGSVHSTFIADAAFPCKVLPPTVASNAGGEGVGNPPDVIADTVAGGWVIRDFPGSVSLSFRQSSRQGGSVHRINDRGSWDQRPQPGRKQSESPLSLTRRETRWIWATGDGNTSHKNTLSAVFPESPTGKLPQAKGQMELREALRSACSGTLAGLNDLLTAHEGATGRAVVVDLDTDEILLSTMRPVTVKPDDAQRGVVPSSVERAQKREISFIEDAANSIPALSRAVSDDFARALHRIWRAREHDLSSSFGLGRSGYVNGDSSDDSSNSDSLDEADLDSEYENIDLSSGMMDDTAVRASERRRNIGDNTGTYTRDERSNRSSFSSARSAIEPLPSRKKTVRSESKAGAATLELCGRVLLLDALLPVRRFVRRYPRIGVAVLRRSLLLESIATASSASAAAAARLAAENYTGDYNQQDHNRPDSGGNAVPYGRTSSEPLAKPPPPPPPLGGSLRSTSTPDAAALAEARATAAAEAAEAARATQTARRWMWMRAFIRTETCARLVASGGLLQLPLALHGSFEQAGGQPLEIDARSVLP